LKAEKAFPVINVIEQRTHAAGLWSYTAEDCGDGLFSIPQTNPHIGPAKPVWQSEVTYRCQADYPIFLSPIYEHLETNIPKPLMRFSDLSFPESSQLFPKHETVQRYLKAYAKDILHMIRFGMQVVDVKLNHNEVEELSYSGTWSVECLDLRTGRKSQETYDAVIVASGNYNVPYIPDIRGVQTWDAAFPASISHSKYYRIPEPFNGKKVVIVGNSASGLDISSQIVHTCKKPLLLSHRSESYLAASLSNHPDIKYVPQITKFDPTNRRVVFADGSEEQEVDRIIFCTGYLYSMPFLSTLSPNPISDGSRVEHTYQHLFYAPNPTLSFLTLPQKVIPFPLAEAQAAIVARVWSGRSSLPTYEDMVGWEKSVIAERGSKGEFHTLKFPKDAEYINMLYDWAVSVDSRAALENDGKGKLPKRWGEWEFWARERFPAIRRAFVERGEDRVKVKTLEEIGFEFETDQKVSQRSDVQASRANEIVDEQKEAL
jgi:cation diffusion facilitator CzcD-associated flavoprotein CzcO